MMNLCFEAFDMSAAVVHEKVKILFALVLLLAVSTFAKELIFSPSVGLSVC